MTRCLIGCFVEPTMDICKSGRSRASSCKLNLSSYYDFLLPTLLSRYQLLFATSFIDAFPSNNGTLCWMKMQEGVRSVFCGELICLKLHTPNQSRRLQPLKSERLHCSRPRRCQIVRYSQADPIRYKHGPLNFQVPSLHSF